MLRLLFLLILSTVTPAPACVVYTHEYSAGNVWVFAGTSPDATSAVLAAETLAGEPLTFTPHLCTPGDCEVSEIDSDGALWRIVRVEQ